MDKINLNSYQNKTSLYQSDMWDEFEGKVSGIKTYKFDSFRVRETSNLFYIGGITKNQLNDNFKSLINTIKILKDFVIDSNNKQRLIIDFQILENDIIYENLVTLLNDVGMFSVKKHIVPRKRCLVDLSKNLDDIKKNYNGKTLNDINRAKKNDIKIIEKWDVDEMYSMYLETSMKQDFNSTKHSIHYFSLMLETLKKYNKGKLLFASKDEYTMIVFALIAEYNNILYYLYTGSKSEFNRFNGSSVLQNHIIEYAKEQNYDFYDLMGIRDKNYGPSKFKLKFGNMTLKLMDSFENQGF
jgi:lipid II:glycine glycyltransferase (peptidoglycan interpeptide bridge formation enzyme)